MKISFVYKGREYKNYDLSNKKVRSELLSTGSDIEIIIRNKIIDILNSFTDQYFYTEAKKRDYLNMGEIIYDAQATPPDPDAQFLKNLYDALWEKEEELEQELQKMTLEELLNLDLQKWAFSQYDRIKNNLEQNSNSN